MPTTAPRPLTSRRKLLAALIVTLLALALVPATQAQAATVTVSFKTGHVSGSTFYTVPGATVSIFNSANVLIGRKASNSAGIASFVLTRGARVRVNSQARRGSCPLFYVYKMDLWWNVPTAGANPLPLQAQMRATQITC